MARPVASTVQNLFQRSEETTNAYWAIAANLTRTADQAIAPDGTMTADLWDDGVASGQHYFSTLSNLTFARGSYTVSIYVKQLAGQFFQIIAPTGTVFGGTNLFANFDVGTGALGTVSSGVTARIESAPNGYYRCSATFQAIRPGSAVIDFAIIATSTETAFAGHTGANRTLYLWGVQLVNANWSGPYVKTVAAPVNTGNIRSLSLSPRTVSPQRVSIRNNYTKSWLLDGATSSATNAGIDYSANNKLSFDCWVYMNGVTAGLQQKICELTTDASTANDGFSLGFTSGGSNLAANYHDAGGTTSWRAGSQPLRKWYHVIGVWDRTLPATTGATTYINGALSGAIFTSTATTGGFFGNQPFFVGSKAGTSQFFNGYIKDPRVCSFSGTFSADDAKTLFAGGIPAGFTKLDEWLGEDTGSTAVDSGTKAKDLTLTNFTYSANIPCSPHVATGFTPFALTATPSVGYTTFADIADKERTDAWAVSIWVNIANLTSVPFGRLKVAGALLGWELQYTANTGFDLVLASTSINLIRKRIPFGTFKPAQYQMVTFTIDGSSTAAGVLGYIDDDLVTTTTITDTLTTSTLGGGVNLTAGARQGGGTGVTGQYLYPRVANRVLTAAEVANMFRNNITPAGAIEYEWSMSNGSGTTLSPSVGGVSGTITTPSWTSTLVPRP